MTRVNLADIQNIIDTVCQLDSGRKASDQPPTVADINALNISLSPRAFGHDSPQPVGQIRSHAVA